MAKHTSRCHIVTGGPAGLQCEREQHSTGGHLWVATDVPDRHEEGPDD